MDIRMEGMHVGEKNPKEIVIIEAAGRQEQRYAKHLFFL